MAYRHEETTATSATARARRRFGDLFRTQGIADRVSLRAGTLLSLAYPWFRLLYG